MEKLKFITGNKTKFREMSGLLYPTEIEQLNIDLPEIQDIDPKIVIGYKLTQAFKHHKGPFLIDDSSFYLKCFNFKLPGTFIKWFLSALGEKKLAAMYKNEVCIGETIIAFAKSPGKIKFFTGTVNGKIVLPKGNYHFGFDPVFLPAGSKLTLGQMKAKGNFLLSPRGLAAEKLKKFLLKN